MGAALIHADRRTHRHKMLVVRRGLKLDARNSYKIMGL